VAKLCAASIIRGMILWQWRLKYLDVLTKQKPVDELLPKNHGYKKSAFSTKEHRLLA
jgi:hypothetical protein